MGRIRGTLTLQHMDALERSLCVFFNRSGRRREFRGLLACVSRLGDGLLWYALMATLPFVYGRPGIAAALHLALVGIVCLLSYRYLKSRFVRERPFVTVPELRGGTAPLDRYSFPSGHTLHAVAFTIVAVSHFPILAWLLVPFTALIAMSRVVLGLHYPSDVVAGALIGAGLAGATLPLL